MGNWPKSAADLWYDIPVGRVSQCQRPPGRFSIPVTGCLEVSLLVQRPGQRTMKLLRRLFVSSLLFCSAGALQAEANDTLQQAEYFADRYRWEKALPLYAEVEQRFGEGGDVAGATYCKIARIRASADGQPLDRIYDALTKEISRVPFGSSPQLRLKALIFKADLETEIDPVSVRTFDAKQRRRDREEILSLAGQLADSHLESRARGELGLVKLLEGDVAAADEIGSVLWKAKETGDFLNEFRFRLAVSALYLAAGRHHDALGHLERAIDLAESHELPSFPAYYGKALVLLAEHRPADADPAVQQVLSQAQLEDASARIAQAMFLKGRLAQEQGRTWEAAEPLREALKLAKEMSYHRLISAVSLELARIYWSHRALWKGLDTSDVGLASSLRAGEPIEPIAHLHVRAAIRADQGHFAEADRLYSNAIRSLDSLLVKFTSAHSRAFLVSKMSELYSDYFSLSLLKFKDPAKAFVAIEQARGGASPTLSEAGGQPQASLEMVLLEARLSNHWPGFKLAYGLPQNPKGFAKPWPKSLTWSRGSVQAVKAGATQSNRRFFRPFRSRMSRRLFTPMKSFSSTF
jgi:tetratricopeptide (TPR) repeat protein